MAITTLEQQGLALNQTFINQVNGIVTQEALYKFGDGSAITDDQREKLSAVVRGPGVYGFNVTIVADAGWALTFDTWAADPEGNANALRAGVQKAWPLLVG